MGTDEGLLRGRRPSKAQLAAVQEMAALKGLLSQACTRALKLSEAIGDHEVTIPKLEGRVPVGGALIVFLHSLIQPMELMHELSNDLRRQAGKPVQPEAEVLQAVKAARDEALEELNRKES